MSLNSECPRCGSGSYEHLETYSYCSECNYDTETNVLAREESRSIAEVQRDLDMWSVYDELTTPVDCPQWKENKSA